MNTTAERWDFHKITWGKYAGRLLGDVARTNFPYLCWVLKSAGIFKKYPAEYFMFLRAAHAIIERELAGERAIHFASIDNPEQTLGEYQDRRTKKLKNALEHRYGPDSMHVRSVLGLSHLEALPRPAPHPDRKPRARKPTINNDEPLA